MLFRYLFSSLALALTLTLCRATLPLYPVFLTSPFFQTRVIHDIDLIGAWGSLLRSRVGLLPNLLDGPDSCCRAQWAEWIRSLSGAPSSSPILPRSWGHNAIAVAYFEFLSILRPFLEQRRHYRLDQLSNSLFVRAKAVQSEVWNR